MTVLLSRAETSFRFSLVYFFPTAKLTVCRIEQCRRVARATATIFTTAECDTPTKRQRFG